MPADAGVRREDRSPLRAASRASVTLLFLLVPLAALPTLGDPYVVPKWHVLDALTLLLFVAEIAQPWREVPWRFGRLVAAGALILVSVTRLAPHGWAWVSPVLLDRAISLLLPLLLWRCSRRGDLAGPMRHGLLASLPIVTGTVLLQALGYDPLWLFEGGDHRSATFGNVNLAAEFLGLGSLALLTLGIRRPTPGWGTELIASVALAAILVLGSRSVLLGLLIGALALWIRGAVARPTLVRIGIAGAIVASTLLVASPVGSSTDGDSPFGALPESGHPLTESGRSRKLASMELRLAAWGGTLMLLADNPWGKGALGFEHAFIPYQLATSPSPTEALWFRSPHNELLRLAVEHGLAGAALLLLLLRPFVLRVWRAPAPASGSAWIVGGGVLLGAQCLFQFPLETGCGALFAALWLAFVLDAVQPGSTAPSGLTIPRGLGLAVGVLATALGLLALHRSALANSLVGEGRNHAFAMRASCELEPRNLGACVRAAWLEATLGQPEEAVRLTEAILRHSPHYYPAIKLLGELRIALGKETLGCRDLALYERLFAGRGLASPIIDGRCPPSARAESRELVGSLFWKEYPGLEREASRSE